MELNFEKSIEILNEINLRLYGKPYYDNHDCKLDKYGQDSCEFCEKVFENKKNENNIFSL